MPTFYSIWRYFWKINREICLCVPLIMPLTSLSISWPFVLKEKKSFSHFLSVSIPKEVFLTMKMSPEFRTNYDIKGKLKARISFRSFVWIIEGLELRQWHLRAISTIDDKLTLGWVENVSEGFRKRRLEEFLMATCYLRHLEKEDEFATDISNLTSKLAILSRNQCIEMFNWIHD